jgi:hypothetical protein
MLVNQPESTLRTIVKVSDGVTRAEGKWKLMKYFHIFSETAPTNTEQSLPVVFDATEDPTLTNLTRSDVNCDKTGTCYDGKCKVKVVGFVD